MAPGPLSNRRQIGSYSVGHRRTESCEGVEGSHLLFRKHLSRVWPQAALCKAEPVQPSTGSCLMAKQPRLVGMQSGGQQTAIRLVS